MGSIAISSRPERETAASSRSSTSWASIPDALDDGLDRLEPTRIVVVERPQRVGPQEDRAQRCAQLVRHRVEKGLARVLEPPALGDIGEPDHEVRARRDPPRSDEKSPGVARDLELVEAFAGREHGVESRAQLGPAPAAGPRSGSPTISAELVLVCVTYAGFAVAMRSRSSTTTTGVGTAWTTAVA